MTHDADIFDRVLSYVKNRVVAIDVGAHKGVWTEKMAPVFGRVYCFEPNILLYSRLSSWSSREFNNVIVYNHAILDIDSYGSLYFLSKSTQKSRSRYVMGDETGQIIIRKLDSYDIKECNLLKIDVEGGEMAVLRGARRILRHQRPVVVVEYKSLNANRFGWSLHSLNTYMHNLGYHLAFSNKPNLVFVI